MARAIAIGLMSGTSYDGVDVALIETDGEQIARLGPTGYRPYSDRERDVVRRAITVAGNLTDRKARPAMLAAAEDGSTVTDIAGRLHLSERRDLTGVLLAIRRGAIVVIVLLGYAYVRLIGETYALVTIGLVSFVAAAQFAPAIALAQSPRAATYITDEEIKKVKGIGEGIFAKMKDQITVK